MTAFVDLNEIYVRKIEDCNDEYHQLLDEVNNFCLSGKIFVSIILYFIFSNSILYYLVECEF